jgi:hypothetical protein
MKEIERTNKGITKIKELLEKAIIGVMFNIFKLKKSLLLFNTKDI